MLVVNIEVWPRGREEQKYKIGGISAGNIAGGRISSYQVRVLQAGYEPEGVPAIDKEFLLRDHDRGAGALALIRDALLIALPPPKEVPAGLLPEPGHQRERSDAMEKRPDSSRSGSATKTAVARFAPANRRRLSGPGLRTFLTIADLWRLTEEQRRLILGYPARSTCQGWIKKVRKYQDITLSVDVLIRISAILGIYAGLKILFSCEEEGLGWLRQPHDARAFGGAAPIDLITSGTQDALMTVRRFVDAACGGFYLGPSPDERDWFPYEDSEIIIVDED